MQRSLVKSDDNIMFVTNNWKGNALLIISYGLIEQTKILVSSNLYIN